MFHYDIIGGVPLPNCPYTTSSIPPIDSNGSSKSWTSSYSHDHDSPRLNNPAISITFYLFTLVFLVFSLLTLKRYNQVKIFNRTINHPSVSNIEYFWFFLLLSISCLVDAIRYTLNFPHLEINYVSYFNSDQENQDTWIVGPEVMDCWLLLASCLVRSSSLLVLSLALNHQVIHRSNLGVAQSPVLPVSISIPRRSSDSEIAPLLVNTPSHDFQDQDEQNDNAGNDEIESEENTPKISKIQEIGGLIYSWLLEYLYSIPALLVSSFLFRIAVLVLSIDSSRLADPLFDRHPTFVDEQGWPVVLISSSLFQIFGLFYLVYMILKTPSASSDPSQSPTLRTLRPFGPLLFSKVVLVLSAFATLFYWLEPSIIMRIVESALNDPKNEVYCIVPPWWWQRIKNVYQITPAHGWASVMDILNWVCGFGIYGLFSFMRWEFQRHADEHIFLVVSEVQSTFGFH